MVYISNESQKLVFQICHVETGPPISARLSGLSRRHRLAPTRRRVDEEKLAQAQASQGTFMYHVASETATVDILQRSRGAPLIGNALGSHWTWLNIDKSALSLMDQAKTLNNGSFLLIGEFNTLSWWTGPSDSPSFIGAIRFGQFGGIQEALLRNLLCIDLILTELLALRRLCPIASNCFNLTKFRSNCTPGTKNCTIHVH